jgi:hypothetical protein
MWDIYIVYLEDSKIEPDDFSGCRKCIEFSFVNNDKWFRVRFENGDYRYINASFIEFIDASPVKE